MFSKRVSNRSRRVCYRFRWISWSEIEYSFFSDLERPNSEQRKASRISDASGAQLLRPLANSDCPKTRADGERSGGRGLCAPARARLRGVRLAARLLVQQLAELRCTTSDPRFRVDHGTERTGPTNEHCSHGWWWPLLVNGLVRYTDARLCLPLPLAFTVHKVKLNAVYHRV